MTSTFFKLFHRSPLSPSSPADPKKTPAIADYGGVFNIETGEWNCGPLVEQKQFRPHFSSNGIEKHCLLKDLDNMYDEIVKHREKEQEVGEEEEAEEQQQQDENNNNSEESSSSSATATSSSSSKNNNNNRNENKHRRRPLRVVCVSDTHDFHEMITLPKGDILIHCGDIMLIDRYNPKFISQSYLEGFFTWLNSQSHSVILFTGGNHCQMLEQIYLEGGVGAVDALAKRAIFLDGDRVVDVFGIRFFGCSFSFGTSKNCAFQNQETLNKLLRVPEDNVIDGTTENSTRRRKNDNDNDENEKEKEKTQKQTKKKFEKRNPGKKVDILITHSNMPPGKEHIVQELNPLISVLGHDHPLHGLTRSMPRSKTLPNRFSSSFSSSDSASIFSSVTSSITSAVQNVFSSPTTQNRHFFEKVPQQHIVEINASIAADLNAWSPLLHVPMTFDLI